MTTDQMITDPELQTVITKLFNRHLADEPGTPIYLTVAEWRLYNAFAQACGYNIPLHYNGHPIHAIHI
jgi:hypothetical protein